MKVTSTDMKNGFGKYLRLCATEPVYITKNGKTIAKLLNHTQADDIIEESVNLRKVYQVDEHHNKDYPPKRVAESIEGYNLERIYMSYEEFTRMNEASTNRYEYIDGEVYMLASPSVYHQQIVSKLLIAFNEYLKEKPCDVFVSPFDVILLRREDRRFINIVQPDLLVACNWKRDVNELGRYTGTPRLVVEVLSPGNTVKEMITKLDLYRDSGIEEYWIVDDRRKTTLVYHFRDYTITDMNIFADGAECESFIYEGFKVKIADSK